MRDQVFIRMLTGDDLLVEAPVTLRWRGRNARALFVFLALQPGKPVTRDRLAGILWPESSQPAARASLRMTLLGLRRTLEPLSEDPLVVTNEAVRLDFHADAVDVCRFERLGSRTDLASQMAALELYRGDLLAGLASPSEVFTDLLRAERERLRESAIATGLSLLAASEQDGARERTGIVARKLLTIDPANEPAHRAIMRAYIEAGDRTAAFRQYDQCRAALRDHYDLDPSAETVALRDEIAAATPRTVDEPNPPTDAAWIVGRETDGSTPESDAAAAALPSRRGLVLLVLTLSASALVLWFAWTTWGPNGSASDDASVRLLLAPIEGELSECRRPDLSRDLRMHLEEALIEVPAVTVILQRTEGAGGSRTYVLNVHVQCRNGNYRVLVTLRREGSNTAEWVGQYDRNGRTLEEFIGPILDDIRPLLVVG